MVPVNIKKCSGYNDVADLLPDGLLIKYKQVWSIRYDHLLDESGDLYCQLILELTQDRKAYDIPIVRIIFEKPTGMILCPGNDLVQLSIDDYKIDGWEHGNFKVYDAEMDTDWELFCEAIHFERGRQKPRFITK